MADLKTFNALPDYRIKSAMGVPIDRLKTINGSLLNNNAWYGVEIDTSINSAECTRIAGPGFMSLHASLPAQNCLKGCVMNDDITVNYYLNATDWTKKASGVPSTITGADGNVMVYKSRPLWWKFETNGAKFRAKVSIFPLTGFLKSSELFYSAYEGYLSGSKLKSLSGVIPTTTRSKTQFRADARANGAGYEQQWYAPYVELCWLMIIEFATLNLQKAVNNNLTTDGYRQGGLGNGVTTAVSTEWNAYNGYKPFITAGASNALANGSGEVSVTISNFGGAGVNRAFTVPRYRGIENVFGHIWKWVDGVTINHTATQREIYVFDNPSNFADGTSLNGRLAGLLPATEGWVRTMLLGDKGDLLPAAVGSGASSTTNFADYFYTPALGSGWRALMCGGSAYDGAAAGPFCAYTRYAASTATTLVGARLFARR